MKITAWSWLALLVIPGCILVQPLDEAKPADDLGSAGSSGKASQAGSAGHNTAGSGSHAGGSDAGGSGAGGSGNRAGAGPVPAGGSANGGAPSGTDFSLFVGTWTVTSGQSTTSCDGGTPKVETIAPGGTDTFGLGTISDLILDPGTECEVLADVNDRTATLNPATLSCSTSDATYYYDLTVDSFTFVVSGNGQTAKASMSTYVVVTDANNNESDCQSDYTWDYTR